jgi:hypothetical protein
VVTQPTCELRATSNAGWLEVSPSTRTGSGKFRLEISENRGRESRTGIVTLTADGFQTTVVVIQEGGGRDD